MLRRATTTCSTPISTAWWCHGPNPRTKPSPRAVLHSARLRTWTTVCHPARRRDESNPAPLRSLAQCKTPDVEHGVPRRSAPLRKEAKPPRGLALCKTRNTACHADRRRYERKPTPRAVLHCARLRRWNRVCHADRRRYERKPTSREVLHCARLGTGCATPIGAATKGSQLPAWSCTVQDARQFTRSSSAATSFSTWAYVN